MVNAGGVSGPSAVGGPYSSIVPGIGNKNEFTPGNAIRLRLDADTTFTEGVKYKVYLYHRVSSNPALPFTLITGAFGGEIPADYLSWEDMSNLVHRVN